MKRNSKTRIYHRFTRRNLREWGYGYLFIAPWLVGVSVFFVYCMFRSFQFAFSKVVLVAGVQLEPLPRLFENFATVLGKETSLPMQMAEFIGSLMLRVPIIVAFALIFAMMLNNKLKGRLFFRVIFFLPVIVATGPIMHKLNAQGVGSLPLISRETLDIILSALPEFLSSPIQGVFSSLIMILWESGIQMLIFLAGLQKVPESLHEASRIDGASVWESFWKITIPVIKPMILLNTIYTIVSMSSSGNAIVNIITGSVSDIGKGYSYSAAVSWLYTLLISLVLTVVYLLFRTPDDRHVRYETKRVVMKGGKPL